MACIKKQIAVRCKRVKNFQLCNLYLRFIFHYFDSYNIDLRKQIEYNERKKIHPN